MKKKNFFKLVQEVKNLYSTEDGKKKLLKNPKKALKEAKIDFPEDMDIEFLENSKNTYNFVVPLEELPREICVKNLSPKPSYQEIGLWMIYQVQSGSPLKERLLKEPVKVLEDKKISLAKGLKINIYCNTEKKMYIVVPRKTSTNEELTEAEMQAVAGGGGFFGSGPTFSTGGQHMGSQHADQTSKGPDTSVDAAYGPGASAGGGGGDSGGGPGGVISGLLDKYF